MYFLKCVTGLIKAPVLIYEGRCLLIQRRCRIRVERDGASLYCHSGLTAGTPASGGPRSKAEAGRETDAPVVLLEAPD